MVSGRNVKEYPISPHDEKAHLHCMHLTLCEVKMNKFFMGAYFNSASLYTWLSGTPLW